jgi:hypothetical protein
MVPQHQQRCHLGEETQFDSLGGVPYSEIGSNIVNTKRGNAGKIEAMTSRYSNSSDWRSVFVTGRNSEESCECEGVTRLPR